VNKGSSTKEKGIGGSWSQEMQRLWEAKKLTSENGMWSRTKKGAGFSFTKVWLDKENLILTKIEIKEPKAKFERRTRNSL